MAARMLKAVATVTIVMLLAGCATKMISVNATPGYSEKLGDVAFIFLRKQVDTAVEFGVEGRAKPTGWVESNIDRAITGLNEHMPKRIPALAKAAGLNAVYIETGNVKNIKDEYMRVHTPQGEIRPRHVVLIIPRKGSVVCSATCRTRISISTSIFDNKLAKEVWSSVSEIGEKSGIHNIEASDVDLYWGVITDQLKKDGMM